VSLEFVIGAACIVAAAAVLVAWMAFMLDAPWFGVAALATAVLCLGIALLAAIEKEDTDKPAGSAAKGAATPRDYFASHLASFRGQPRLTRIRLQKSMCLVRYYDRADARKNGGDPNATWWTTCKANHRLRTIAAVRRVLALPHDWGARDGRVFARIPAGARVTYLRGLAARQCESHNGQCYKGGGTQLLFVPDDFQRAWFTRRECARGHNENAPTPFVKCTG
jgi:hypothetical protein